MEDNALTPIPLEFLNAPQSLSGESGTNRAPAFITQQISATNDLQAVQCWLAEFDKSPQTQRSYRKEAERLLLWSLIEKQKSQALRVMIYAITNIFYQIHNRNHAGVDNANHVRISTGAHFKAP
jgi:hypothetical protein